jgi:hypothetical protein
MRRHAEGASDIHRPAYGQPRSKFGLGTDFAKWATEAGLPARCRMHGLRKGGMRRLAVSGHKTLTEVQRYTVDADMKRLADSAMAKRTKRVADYTNSSTRVHKLAKKPA